MPAPTVPFDVYVTQQVIPAELALITVGTYFTTLFGGAAQYPNWHPIENEDRIYEQADSTLLVWNAPTRAIPEDMQDYFVVCPILFIGIRKGPSVGLLDAAKFMNDVRRVMLSNATRDPVVNPGVPNTWGVNTEETGARPFEHLSSDGIPVYIFESGYDVTVRWPKPKGY